MKRIPNAPLTQDGVPSVRDSIEVRGHVGDVQDLLARMSNLTALASATAGGTYTATEQAMLQDVHDAVRQLLDLLKGA